MHIYSKDQQAFHLQRTPAEKWWSRANTFIVVVQLACFLSVVIRTIAGASNSMSNSFFTNSVLSLKAPYIVDGCVYNVTRRHALFNNVQYSLSRDNVGYFVSRAVLNIRYLIALAAAHVVVSATNRLWFETNTHEIRYHFVVFRKDMITTWEILLMVLSFVVTLGITEENRIMTDYITHCAANRSTSGHFYNSVQPYTELIVSYIISISATVINGAFAVWNLSKKNPLDLMLREAKRQQEEWRQAMEQYYGLGNSDATTAAQSQEHAGGTQPQVIYADNRATTVSPNADAAAALPVNGNELVKAGEADPLQRHRHGHHHSTRKGLGHRLSAISSSLRRRSHSEDEMKLNAPQPPLQFTPLPPQKQAHLQQQQPHFGPSVSRPLTPTLNEEYDQVEMPEVRQQGVGEGALGDRVGPTAEMMGGPGAVIESSNSGRYDLHEVDDDEDDERGAVMEADIKNSSLRGGQASYSIVGGAGGVPGGLRVRGMSGSEASTALVAAHLATTPPPPPVHSGDRRQQAQMSRGQMLAPPSPLQGGAETTDDTVHL
ncbi:conserved hypothetical protein [Leishmania infantum JPCM5]|uniref:Uncharacterized protein n=2 Tax=Leishmania infantum TaxID=5671 RepID=A4HZG0_LEIIN|nr:conserved hypothetical protein [Leishmania infantum JPCM5]CAC9486696.1 hypothetical_protein_-_conserved [Leishmania infantum]CAM67872.1 conserved hypothetical protein [Leishmania infantum JPCM5]SUZ41643.1 hypothetical_protein_-_conserved [Leishmania infantum]|eukprot:XP_001465451.1 conserved hypothetical protein [Leishmania infantum JPCM5]